jgi:hypothetical protein
MPGSQWSALWVRMEDDSIVCSETKPWDGNTGGYGYSECKPILSPWLPGDYQVQLFVGTEWVSSGYFTMTGQPPTFTPTRTPTATRTITPTPSNSATLKPTSTKK